MMHYFMIQYTPAQLSMFAALTATIIAVTLRNAVFVITFALSICISYRMAISLSLKQTYWNSAFIITVVDFIKISKIRLEALCSQKRKHPDTNKLDIVSKSTPSKEANAFIELVVRDFVDAWYQDISTNHHVSTEISQILSDASKVFMDKIQNCNKFILIERFAKLFTSHLTDIHTAQQVLKQQPHFRRKNNREHEFKMMKDVEAAFLSLGKFHFALKDPQSEVEYLRSVTEVILKILVPEDCYNCYMGKEIILEIFMCNIIMAIMDMVSETYWLHKMLILLLTDEDIVELAAENVCDHETLTNQSRSFVETKTNRSRVQTAASEMLNGNNLDDHDNLPPTFERLPPLGASLTDESPLSQAIEQSTSMIRSSSMILPTQNTRPSQLANLRTFSSSDLPAIGAVPQQHRFYVPVTEMENSNEANQHCHTDIVDMNVEDDLIGIESPEPAEMKDPISGASEALLDFTEETPVMRFIDVDIVNLEHAKEPAGGIYILFTIQYTAWYIIEGKWKLQNGTVRRRYREFVTLHDRLEEHKVLKRSMSGIKGPQRWGIIPTSNLEGSKVEKRRQFLSDYLRNLIVKEELCNSTALKEFLAYDGDGSIAFVRSAPDNLPRFDQMFITTVKGISGVIDKITNVLPSFPDSNEVPTLPEIQRRKQQLEEIDISEWSDPDQLEIYFNHHMPKENVEPSFNSMMDRSIKHFEHLCNDDTNKDGQCQTVCAEQDEFYDVFEKSIDEFCDPDGTDEPVLACSLLNLALKTVEDMDTWIRQEKAVHIAKVTLGVFLENFIKREVDEITTEKYCTYLMRKLRDTLWPNGKLDINKNKTPSEEQKQAVYMQARKAVENFFPGWLPCVIGNEEYQHSVDTFMASLNHEKLNRNFALRVLDVLLEELFSELGGIKFQQQLIEDKNNTHADLNKASILSCSSEVLA